MRKSRILFISCLLCLATQVGCLFAAEQPWELSGSITNFPFDRGVVGIEVNRSLLRAGELSLSWGLSFRDNFQNTFVLGADVDWLYQAWPFLSMGPVMEGGRFLGDMDYFFLRAGLRLAWTAEDWSMFWEPSSLLSDHMLEKGRTQFIPFRFGIAARF